MIPCRMCKSHHKVNMCSIEIKYNRDCALNEAPHIQPLIVSATDIILDC